MVNAWVKETRQAKKRKTKKWSELALFVENGETGRILQKVTHWSLNDLGEKKKTSKKDTKHIWKNYNWKNIFSKYLPFNLTSRKTK